jgi:hypothetical protein
VHQLALDNGVPTVGEAGREPTLLYVVMRYIGKTCVDTDWVQITQFFGSEGRAAASQPHLSNIRLRSPANERFPRCNPICALDSLAASPVGWRLFQ